MVNKTKINKKLLILGGVLMGLATLLVAREIDNPLDKTESTPEQKAVAPIKVAPPKPATPTSIKDTFTAYYNAAPDKAVASSNIRMTYNLPQLQKNTQIIELEARNAKANFEKSEWKIKEANLREGTLDSKIDEISTAPGYQQSSTPNYYGNHRGQSEQLVETNKKETSEINLSDFVLRGFSQSKSSINRTAYLLYKQRPMEVQDGNVLFGKITISISTDGVSLCKGEECQALYL